MFVRKLTNGRLDLRVETVPDIIDDEHATTTQPLKASFAIVTRPLVAAVTVNEHNIEFAA
jgi:hypothetical protein